MKFKQMSTTILVVAILSLVGYMAGCGSKGGVADPQSGGITLTATPICLFPDERSSSVVVATVTKTDGSAADIGTRVTFRISSGIGKFANGTRKLTTHTTSTNGVASVVAIAGNIEGILAVTAESNGMKQRVNIPIDEDCDPCGDTCPDTDTGTGTGTDTGTDTGTGTSTGPDTLPVTNAMIMVDAPSLAMAAGSDESVTLTVSVADSEARLVPIGTPVTFSTTLGSFENGKQTYTLTTTDETATVQTDLFAGDTPGMAEVTVSAEGSYQLFHVAMIEP